MATNFNFDHYRKVREKREQLGMEVADLNKQLEDDPLIGRTIIDTTTNEKYVVDAVNEHWHIGWYKVLTLNHNGSHRIVFWENISCGEPIIINQINENKQSLKLI